MCCLEGLLPESGFVGHHYSVLKERHRPPSWGLGPFSSPGPPAQRVQHLAMAPRSRSGRAPPGTVPTVRNSSLRTA